MSTKPALLTNPRGIPQAPFIDNVEEHVGGPDAEVESALRQFQEAIAKYRYMELNLNTRKKALLDKIPDIEKTLAMVQFLKDKREGKLKAKKDEDLEDEDDESSGAASSSQTLTFELNDTLYAEAEVNTTEDIVYLWLGANVMLSYTQEEAIKLLTEKLTAAKQSLSNATEDLEFLREQITIMEVNTARCYNWDVKRRREKRLAGEVTEGPSKA